MNFLGLVNRARRECGASGAALTSIATDSALTAEGLRFKEWVNEAWKEIQTDNPDWDFMRKQVAFNTSANVGSYLPAAANVPDLGRWKRDSFRAYRTSVGVPDEQILPYQDYETFRNLYLFGNMRLNRSRPVLISIDPATKSLLLGPVPDDSFTVVGEYFRQPSGMTLDSDTPDIPEQYHMLVVYKTMISYAGYEFANEVLARGEKGVRALASRMEIDQAPILVSGAPLA